MSELDYQALAKGLRRHLGHLIHDHTNPRVLPTKDNAARICDWLLAAIFPGYFLDPLATSVEAHLNLIEASLTPLVGHALGACSSDRSDAITATEASARARKVTRDALGDLEEVARLVATDVEAAFANDPAATERETIILSYPCIEALAIQRFAHCLYRRQVPLLPRMLTEVAHSRTGIDIHPGATIGESFFIDHGTGVVIGETSTIGKHCVLYQSVTLGAWNPTAKDSDGELKRGHANKRHPDLEDHVTVYAGATILGGTTRIGHHSVIGGKVWLTNSVEPHSVVMAEEPKLTIRKRKLGKSDD